MSQLRSKQSRGRATYTLLLATTKHDDVESGNPALKLASPVVEGRLGDDDEVRAVDAAVELEVPKESDGLESLSESL